ncbi:MAG: glycosyltransferase family 4 protein [Gemmatimonadales bacterium]
MRIAQVGPLYESVPPKLYGGTERVVAALTDALVAMGHDVTLFASGDSVTTARLVPCAPQSLRLDPACIDQLAHHIVMLERVSELADRFDLIHYHIDYLHFPLSRRLGVPHVTTLHGRLDIPDLVPLYREFREMPVVSISDAQRAPLPWLNWQGTVYHGLPVSKLHLHETPGRYLAFIGRISPEKGIDQAIGMARRSGVPLKIAAKIDKVDQAYFDATIRPLIDGTSVELIGEITDREKDDFLGNALALAFLIDWPEPFGLAMIEAMACGTPVIAFRCGSVGEVIADGVTGIIVDTDDEAVAAVARAPELDRRACRAEFERRFDARRMADEYLTIYRSLAETGRRTAA